MSSILDALEKLEATRGPQPPLRPGGAPRRERRWSVVALVVIAVVVGAGGMALLLGRGTATEPATPEAVATRTAEPRAEKDAVETAPQARDKRAHTMGTNAPKRAPAHATAPPAAGPAVAAAAAAKRDGAVAPSMPAPSAVGASPPANAIGTPPASQNAGATPPPFGVAANVGTAAPVMNAAAPVATPAPHAAAPVPAPDATGRERPWGAEPPATKTPPPGTLAMAREAPPPTAPPVPRAAADDQAPPVSTRTPAGAPRMRVSFLVYSSVAERRSVALTFDGSGLTTLREGEESNGVEVVRIRPDRVDLRWQGEAFTLEVRS